MPTRIDGKRPVALARIFRGGEVTTYNTDPEFPAKKFHEALLKTWKENLQMYYCQEEHEFLP